MEHTPYGYDIIDGRAAVNEGQAAVIRQICENYLSGMSFVRAAAAAGLSMSHCGVKNMMLNRRYLGDGFYPPILTKEIADRIEAERIRREESLGRVRQRGSGAPIGTIYTRFSAPETEFKYEDPTEQAEYAYGMIRNEVG